MSTRTGSTKKRGASKPAKGGRPSLFFEDKSVRTKRKKTPKKKNRTGMLPDWLHWLITGAAVLTVLLLSYYLLLKPYFYRWMPCVGTKEYGTCLPEGYGCYGIDVSHHQGQIDWNRVSATLKSDDIPVRFVFIKATEGGTFLDSSFRTNIESARKAGFVCGIYHFYNPGTSPRKQADFYISNVRLEKGDLAPVVDVERPGRSAEALQRELVDFLSALESHYGVRPIIYTSAKFRHNYLNNPIFDNYPFWVAHYYVSRPATDHNWSFWQFTDRAKVDGIDGYTDFNVFNGSDKDFENLRIR